MYKGIAYIKHLLTSTNQHGVHSPFVYGFVTKCLYVKSKFKASKSESILLKSIPYFEAKKIKILALDAQIEHLIQKELELKSAYTPPFDLMYADTPSIDILSIYEEQLHNDSMLVLNNIHSNKSNSNTWDALKQDNAVTVSIDMFYCGALFFRKEQVKEHFKIRI